MLCGTSERVPVSAFIHLLPRKKKVSALRGSACWGSCTHLGHLCRQCATQPSIKLHSQLKDPHRVHVDRFQVIQVRVTRLLRTIGIECARNLKELLSEVREKPTR